MNTRLIAQVTAVCCSAGLLTAYVVFAQKRAQPSAPATATVRPENPDAPAERILEAPRTLAPSSKSMIIDVKPNPDSTLRLETPPANQAVQSAAPALIDARQVLPDAPAAPEATVLLPRTSLVPSTKSARVFTPEMVTPAARPPAAGETAAPGIPAPNPSPRIMAPGSKSIDLRLFQQSLQQPATPAQSQQPSPRPRSS